MNPMHALMQKNFSTLASLLCEAEVEGSIVANYMRNDHPLARLSETPEDDAYAHAVRAARAGNGAYTLILAKALGTHAVVPAPDLDALWEEKKNVVSNLEGVTR